MPDRVKKRRKKGRKKEKRAAAKKTVDPFFQYTLLLIVVVGMASRVMILGQSAVEHFDEGVYASNLFFENHRFPNRHLYAPPLVPSLIEWSLVFQGFAYWTPLFPSLMLGAATIWLSGMVGRSWFGREAGLVAALLAAVCEPHMLYSATALTDVPLTFFLMATIGAISVALIAKGYQWVLLAAALAAAAWWSKYNGWLAIAIPFGTLVILIPWNPKAVYTRFAIFALIAVAAWMPVLQGLQPLGGYRVVSENHAQYMLGVAHWGPSLMRQVQSLGKLDLGITTAILSTLVFAVLGTRFPLVLRIVGAAVVAIVGWLAGTIAAVTLVTASLLTVLLVRTLRDNGEYRTRLCVGLLFVWWVGLTFAIPLYHPYPRLTLPWYAASWLIIAGGAGTLLSKSEQTGDSAAKSWLANPQLAAVLVVVLLTLGSLQFPRTELFTSRLGVYDSVRTMETQSQTPAKQREHVVYVLGEPAFLYHLRTQSWNAVPVASIPKQAPENFKGDVYVVLGPHAMQSIPVDQVSELKKNSSAISRFQYRPSWLVATNLFKPDEFEQQPRTHFLVCKLR